MALLVTTTLAAPSVARADVVTETAAEAPADPRATALKAQGDEAMLALRYDEALVAYRGAYALWKNPALHYNQARALQALGDYGAALELYELFDAQAPAALKARVPRLAALIEESRARVALLEVRCNVEGGQVLVNDRLVATTPSSKPVRLTAGRVTVRVLADGHHPFTREVVLAPRGIVALEVELMPKDASGVLIVSSNIRGARLLIDGNVVGDTPAELALRAGNHVARVESAGHVPATRPFVLGIGERKVLDIELARVPPVTTRWWFWASIGAAAALGVTAAVVLTSERSPDAGTISPGRVAGPLLAF